MSALHNQVGFDLISYEAYTSISPDVCRIWIGNACNFCLHNVSDPLEYWWTMYVNALS